MPELNKRREAAIEAAAKAAWESGRTPSERTSWEPGLTGHQRAKKIEEWRAGAAAYDAALGGEAEPSDPQVEAARSEIAKLLVMLRHRRQRGEGEGDPVKVAIEVRDTARAALVAALSEHPETDERETCPDCDGKGDWSDLDSTDDRLCGRCKGSGKIPSPESLQDGGERPWSAEAVREFIRRYGSEQLLTAFENAQRTTVPGVREGEQAEGAHEVRQGPDSTGYGYRATCTCGWTDTGASLDSVETAGDAHRAFLAEHPTPEAPEEES